MVTRSKVAIENATKNLPLNVLIATLTRPCKVVLNRFVIEDGTVANQMQPDSIKNRKIANQVQPAPIGERPNEGERRPVAPVAPVAVENRSTVSKIPTNFAVDDIIWAKMRGFPYWPAKASKF